MQVPMDPSLALALTALALLALALVALALAALARKAPTTPIKLVWTTWAHSLAAAIPPDHWL